MPQIQTQRDEQPLIHGEYAPSFFGLLASRVVDSVVESGAIAAERFGISAPVRTFSTLVLLSRAPMSVTEIAQQLGVTHAAVIKHTRSLVALGLIDRGQDAKDARRRPLTLTDAGREEVERIDAFMASAAKVYREIFETIGIDVFEGLKRMEREFNARDFATRMRDVGIASPATKTS